MGYYYVQVTLPSWDSGATQDAEAVQAAAGRTCTSGTCNGIWEPAGSSDIYVTAVLRSGDTSVFNPIGTLSSGALINPNEDITEINFGYYDVPSRVYGKVYLDSNGDGDQDPGEADLSGVTVELWRCLDASCTTSEMVPGFSTTTIADGSYGFSNPSGGTNNQYFIKVTQPADTRQTADPDESGVCTTCDN